MRFAEPWWLVLVILGGLPWWAARAGARLTWPSFGGFDRGRRRATSVLAALPMILQSLALICLAVALARPVQPLGRERVASRGVAIVVALDHSSTMSAADDPTSEGTRTRLDSARQTLDAFIAGRPDDLIGLVTFARWPETACPPTLDHAYLRAAARSVGPTPAGDDGTNLGDALAWALRDVQAAQAPRRVIVLITDGRNEPGIPEALEPELAARLIQRRGVVLHTVALGGTGAEPADETGPDLARLQELARLGGGQTFHASNPEGLAAVFATIDRLERGNLQGTVRTRVRELYLPWTLGALSLLALDLCLRSGRWRRLP